MKTNRKHSSSTLNTFKTKATQFARILRPNLINLVKGACYGEPLGTLFGQEAAIVCAVIGALVYTINAVMVQDKIDKK